MLGVALAMPSFCMVAAADEGGEGVQLDAITTPGDNAVPIDGGGVVAAVPLDAQVESGSRGNALEPSSVAARAASDVQVSADALAAKVEGCAFAVHEFYRAQKGSNKPVGDAYQGYHYLNGADAQYGCLVATPAYVVVYIPAGVAQDVGLDLEQEDAQASLKACLMALDGANAGGYDCVGEDVPWYFTHDERIEP